MGGLTANLLGSQTNPKAWIEHIERSQTLYCWVMNNHWHTNYKADQDGPTVFRFSLRPHGKYDAVEAQRFGIGASQPMIVSAARGPAMERPALTVEGAGVIVTCLKPADDGKGWIVRLYGASGKAEKVKLSFAAGNVALYASDIGEKKGAKIDGVVRCAGIGIGDSESGAVDGLGWHAHARRG